MRNSIDTIGNRTRDLLACSGEDRIICVPKLTKFRGLETTAAIRPMEYFTVLKKEINKNIIGVRE